MMYSPDMFGSESLHLLGKKVRMSPLVRPAAKVRLSLDCPCHDAFRREFDAWLKEFFGMEEVAYVAGNTLFVSPAVFALLKDACGAAS